MDPSINDALARQDSLITRAQSLSVMTEGALRHLLGRRWSIVLPGVYAGFTGELTDRQRRRATLLYGGKHALLADLTALRGCGVRYLPPTAVVHLLIPAQEHRVSRDFVAVRRTHRMPYRRVIDGMPYCPPERALVDAAARLGDLRTARALVSDAVQRGIVDVERLQAEVPHLAGRGSGVAAHAIAGVIGGGRSAPELDFLDLCTGWPELPPPSLNTLLELPGGRLVSPDAIFLDAGLVHETNGREHHAGEDRFEDMQSRHAALTAAGLVVLHSSPRQLREEGRRIMDEVVQCYQRGAGRGLPPGVRVVRASAPVSHSSRYRDGNVT